MNQLRIGAPFDCFHIFNVHSLVMASNNAYSEAWIKMYYGFFLPLQWGLNCETITVPFPTFLSCAFCPIERHTLSSFPCSEFLIVCYWLRNWLIKTQVLCIIWLCRFYCVGRMVDAAALQQVYTNEIEKWVDYFDATESMIREKQRRRIRIMKKELPYWLRQNAGKYEYECIYVCVSASRVHAVLEWCLWCGATMSLFWSVTRKKHVTFHRFISICINANSLLLATRISGGFVYFYHRAMPTLPLTAIRFGGSVLFAMRYDAIFFFFIYNYTWPCASHCIPFLRNKSF